MKTELMKFANFTLYFNEGVGNNDTPYQELVVKSTGIAEKHVVGVELDPSGVYAYDGTPIKYAYKGVEVKHGMRMHRDTLQETKEYIDVLNEALEVAFEVQKYAILNGWWA